MGRERSWDDQEIYDASQKGERLERYRAVASARDVIRVLGSPWSYVVHWLGDKGTYGGCGKNEEGDGTCLFCAAKDADGNPKYPPSEKYGCLVVHIKRKEAKKEWQYLHALKFWGFGRDKYKALFELREDYGDVRKIDLMISCADEQMQKLNIAPTGKDSEADAKAIKEQLEHAQKWFKLYVAPATVEYQKKLLGQAEDFVEVAAESAKPAAAADDSDEPASLEDEMSEILDGIDGIE